MAMAASLPANARRKPRACRRRCGGRWGHCSRRGVEAGRVRPRGEAGGAAAARQRRGDVPAWGGRRRPAGQAGSCVAAAGGRRLASNQVELPAGRGSREQADFYISQAGAAAAAGARAGRREGQAGARAAGRGGPAGEAAARGKAADFFF
uniref:Uncharacterized protein n=1 Tax=Oryza nivara TaxID=4536 RepID=A0A0E0HBV6_ORYNI